jgi:hypothetical protein
LKNEKTSGFSPMVIEVPKEKIPFNIKAKTKKYFTAQIS